MVVTVEPHATDIGVDVLKAVETPSMRPWRSVLRWL